MFLKGVPPSLLSQLWRAGATGGVEGQASLTLRLAGRPPLASRSVSGGWSLKKHKGTPPSWYSDPIYERG